MEKQSFTLLLYVSLAVASLPLACGDDPAPPSGDDADPGGAGAGATGGSAQGGSMGGQAADGSGGRTTGGSGSVMGGNGGNGASATGGTSVGGAGGAPGGEAGMSGTGAAGQGGFSGASDGGAGGEGGVDEETARCERICSRVDYLMCESWSACVVFYCEVAANTYPYCKPYADAYRKCVDEEVTPDGFVCWAGHATALYVPGKSPCYAEVVAADDANCL